MNQQRLLQPTFQQDIVRQGLFAEYHFDEKSGAYLLDYSGNNNHGILGNSLAANSNWPIRVPVGYHFKDDDFVELPLTIKNLLTKNGEFTVEIVLEIFTAQAIQIILASSLNSTDRFTINGTINKIRHNLYNGITYVNTEATGYVEKSPCFISTKMSNQFTETMVNKNMSVSSIGSNASATSACRFGLRTDNTLGLIGIISYASFYNRKLTSNEQNHNYNAVKNIMKKKGIYLP